MHWETINAFRERYPAVEVRDTLYEIDGSIVTCSGGTATFDLILHALARRHSAQVAGSVSEQFLHSEIRAPEARQRLPADRRAGTWAPELVRAVDIMETNVETPLSLAQVARSGRASDSGVMARLFVAQPSAVRRNATYAGIRLERARGLLRHGNLTVGEVALATGFASPAHFARAYKARHGCRPSADRAAGVQD
ncbi:MAG: helix-turn-helix domain-containing protein [Rhodovibrio sp.]|nr:helix-turn-helix domain-containing protein [Rhodovibrio sp.]